MVKMVKKKLIWAGLGGLMLVLVIVPILVDELSRPELEIIFFDVGQGDSIYIETKNNFQILIDGGPSSAVLDKLGEEMPFYDREIELMVLTHPDRDHLFGLLEVLKAYKVKNILWTGIVKDTAEYKEWVKLIEEEQANIIIAQAGQKIRLRSDLYLLVLHPFENLEGKEEKYINDTSIVAKLVFGDKSFLLTGDISSKIEKQLTDVEADILKVAHHGSNTSTCEEFVRAVNPKIAVISVGENNWGHPAENVLQTLKQFGINVLITKEIGDIKFSF